MTKQLHIPNLCGFGANGESQGTGSAFLDASQPIIHNQ